MRAHGRVHQGRVSAVSLRRSPNRFRKTIRLWRQNFESVAVSVPVSVSAKVVTQGRELSIRGVRAAEDHLVVSGGSGEGWDGTRVEDQGQEWLLWSRGVRVPSWISMLL